MYCIYMEIDTQHTYTQTHIHTHTHTQRETRTHARMYTRMHAQILHVNTILINANALILKLDPLNPNTLPLSNCLQIISEPW